MQSLTELYKKGRGPSSSHTLAPERACRLFTEVCGVFPYYQVQLYGSLSLTGKGHGTDRVIIETLPGETEVKMCLNWDEEFPNGFYLRGLNENHIEQVKWTVFSLGGGTIRIKEYPVDFTREIYSENSWKEITEVLEHEGLSLTEYIYRHEPDLHAYLLGILDAELACVDRGLQESGILPGKLHLKRSAGDLYRASEQMSGTEKERMRMMAYAYAASEENADGHSCVTAPTLGACGVIASVCYYAVHDLGIDLDRIADALAVGGIFGNLIKQNATISGAVGGCQAEIGAAVSMAAAICAYLEGLDRRQIEYAAEIGMEHNLGLTCDPVMGYVMIPCIERNAMGVLRAYDAVLLSKYMSRIKRHLVSFDMVVHTMNETGNQIPITLKETAEGGLALEFERNR